MIFRLLLSVFFCFTFASASYSQEETKETVAKDSISVAKDSISEISENEKINSNMSKIIDRLRIPGPLTFNGNEFFLVWSKQNSPTWAQQQYVQRDDDFNNYKELINISYFDKEIDIDTAVKQKVEYVQKKKQDKDKNFFINVTESPDENEIVVDYLITITPKDGEPYAEYDMDRFISHENRLKKKYFVIFSYSKRFFGDLKSAAKSLSKERSKLMEEIISLKIPKILYKPTEVEPEPKEVEPEPKKN